MLPADARKIAAEEFEISKRRLFQRFFEVIERPDGQALVVDKRTGIPYPLGRIVNRRGREERKEEPF